MLPALVCFWENDQTQIPMDLGHAHIVIHCQARKELQENDQSWLVSGSVWLGDLVVWFIALRFSMV